MFTDFALVVADQVLHARPFQVGDSVVLPKKSPKLASSNDS